MKSLFATLFLLAALAQADIVTIGGQTSWGDSARWGGTVDSTSYLLARGNALRRDSLGTWVVNTTDSCSKPMLVSRGGQRPIWKTGEFSFEVRASSGNTDSTQVNHYWESRYCLDPRRSLGCDSWVPFGRFTSYLDVTIRDSVLTQATTAGTTWKPTAYLFNVPRGDQLRVCVDGYQAGGATGDSTFFRRHVLRLQ